MAEDVELKYPLFAPPADLAAKRPEEWDLSEARRYRDWLFGEMPSRIQFAMAFHRIPSLGSPSAVLLRLGERVAELLKEPATSLPSREEEVLLAGHRIVQETGPLLSPLGYAIVADVGLIFAELLLREHSHLHWEVTRKPKSDADYNLPVIVGFASGERMNPLRIAHVIGLRILEGESGPDRWAHTYERWSSKA